MLSDNFKRRNYPKVYPGTSIRISSPFFSVKCRDCGAQYWSTRPVERCHRCKGDNVLCEQGPLKKDKASKDKASPEKNA